MISKVEAEFWMWKGIVERKPEAWASWFDLFMCGCPEYLIRAICDVRGLRYDGNE